MLSEADKKTVFDIIHQSIKTGLQHGHALKPDLNDYPDRLKQPRAVFVTLKLDQELRGCIGTTEAHLPLISAIAHYAHAAAFSDPRFNPITEKEYAALSVSLSVLTEATPITFKDEQDLIGQLRPGTDGLIISKGDARATFLPAVWESLTHPEEFVCELKKKAGITPTDCPDSASRYTAEHYQ